MTLASTTGSFFIGTVRKKASNHETQTGPHRPDHRPFRRRYFGVCPRRHRRPSSGRLRFDAFSVDNTCGACCCCSSFVCHLGHVPANGQRPQAVQPHGGDAQRRRCVHLRLRRRHLEGEFESSDESSSRSCCENSFSEKKTWTTLHRTGTSSRSLWYYQYYQCVSHFVFSCITRIFTRYASVHNMIGRLTNSWNSGNSRQAQGPR